MSIQVVTVTVELEIKKEWDGILVAENLRNALVSVTSLIDGSVESWIVKSGIVEKDPQPDELVSQFSKCNCAECS